MGKERITQKEGERFKVRGLVMQREGISTLNIYGTPPEPLCKICIFFAIKNVVYKKWMVEVRKEIYLFL